jgi:hypothetical protein
MIREISYYSNMAVGLYRLIGHPPLRDPAAALREQMEHREERFLELAREIVFAHPEHPYHEMFRLAGCGYQDLADSVGRQGLENTLSSLAREGVYLAHDEFKGKTPIVRGGREIRSTPGSFLNPRTRGYIETRSSGSRSSGTPTRKSTEFRMYREVHAHLELLEFGLDSRVCAQVRPILPSSMGLGTSVRYWRRGRKIEKWFSMRGTLPDSGHYRFVTGALVLLGRGLGASMPMPTYLPGNDFSPVARWLAAQKRQGNTCVLRSYVSPAVRVAVAARDAKLDISGTIFMVDGEALTDAKRAEIEAAGCEAYPKYSISEVGNIGHGCRHMRTGNCVHVFRDAVAVISRVRRAPLSDADVNSLLFTNLLPVAPRFLINAEMDDAGILEPAACQCEYSKAGMNQQLRDIFSYGKLTGQGVTLHGSDVVRILEDALPRRFGGAAGDYQLVEREGRGQTQLDLRVSPRVRSAATVEIRDFFLSQLESQYGGALAARQWRHSQGLQVVVEEPSTTPSGKLLPLHILSSERTSEGTSRVQHVATA